jgi:hypothetical protein
MLVGHFHLALLFNERALVFQAKKRGLALSASTPFLCAIERQPNLHVVAAVLVVSAWSASENFR